MSTEAIGLYGMVRIDGATLGQRAMEGVRKGFDQAGDAAQSAGQKVSRWIGEKMRDSIQNTVAAGTRLLGMLAGVSVAASGVFAVSAIRASTEYEQLQARLEAVTGSAEVMARKLEFAQRVANPSNFTFKQLADATVLLEAFGVNAERALPTVARLGMAFGAGDDQLQMLVRGLGDLATGKFPEADVTSAFGLNRSMFEAKGIKFDGTGQLESSATEAFKALEQIVNERYGNIFDKMASTGSAKLASLSDVWEKFQRTVGDGIMKMLGPSLETLTRGLSALTESGVLKDAVEGFSDGFLKLFDATSKGDGLVRFIAGVASFISSIPTMISNAGKAIKYTFDTIGENVHRLFEYFEKTSGGVVKSLTMFLEEFFNSQIRKIQLLFKGDFTGALAEHSGIPAMARTTDRMGVQFKEFNYDPFKIDPFANQDAWTARMLEKMAPMDMKVPDASGNWLNAGDKPSEIDDSNTLKEIRDNTHATATKLADLHRQVLGTGERGQIGATPAEIRGGGARAGDTAMTPYGPVPVELILRMDTPGMQRFVRVENARSNGRGFNPR